MNTNSDQLIREALRQEEERVEKALEDDLRITELIIRSFRGKQRWLTIFPILLSLVYTGLLVWAGYEFFGSDTTKHQIAWATLFVCFAMSVGLTKIWVWGEWRRLAMTREVKRLELRVVELGQRVGAE